MCSTNSSCIKIKLKHSANWYIRRILRNRKSLSFSQCSYSFLFASRTSEQRKTFAANGFLVIKESSAKERAAWREGERGKPSNLAILRKMPCDKSQHAPAVYNMIYSASAVHTPPRLWWLATPLPNKAINQDNYQRLIISNMMYSRTFPACVSLRCWQFGREFFKEL